MLIDWIIVLAIQSVLAWTVYSIGRRRGWKRAFRSMPRLVVIGCNRCCNTFIVRGGAEWTPTHCCYCGQEFNTWMDHRTNTPLGPNGLPISQSKGT